MLVGNWNGYEIVSLSLFDAKPSIVAEAIKELLAKHWLVTVQPSALEINRIYFSRPASSAKDDPILLWEPKNAANSTVFFSQLEDGWQTLVYAIQKRLKTRAVRIIITLGEGIPNAKWDFEYITESEQRRVALIDDFGRLEFFQNGPIQQFENALQYQNRKKRDRFNSNLVISYLQEIGYNIMEPDFLIADNVLKVTRARKGGAPNSSLLQ